MARKESETIRRTRFFVPTQPTVAFFERSKDVREKGLGQEDVIIAEHRDGSIYLQGR